MSAPLVIHLHAEGFERAYQALTLACTARALGQPVTVVLAFGALRAFAEERLGEPLPGPDLWVQKRAAALGVAPMREWLKQAAELKVRLCCCETVLAMAGIDREQLAGRIEVVGLVEVVEAQRGAQLLYV